MLISWDYLKGASLVANDGEIGAAKDIYFDPRIWIVRYLVVHTSSWLRGRDSLISPRALGPVDTFDRKIFVKLARANVEKAPAMSVDLPLARNEEAAHFNYYGLPDYWGGIGPGMKTVPGMADPLPVAAPVIPSREDVEYRSEINSQLQSANAVKGYHLLTTDGELGHVAEFLIDPAQWRVRFLVVNTRNWGEGKTLTVPVALFEGVDWFEREVTIALSRDELMRRSTLGPVQVDHA